MTIKTLTPTQGVFQKQQKNPRHCSVEVTKYPLKCLIMEVESAFRDQKTRKLVSFNILVSNLLCHVCERSYRAKSGVITQECFREQTLDIIVTCEL